MSRFRFRGRHRAEKQPRADRIPLLAVVPNAITSMAVCGGIASIAIAAMNYANTLMGKLDQVHWSWCLVALLVSCVCDALDGRAARLLKVSSKLGAELDSLADFVNFGVAPALLMFFWVIAANPSTSAIISRILFAFALFYAMCDAFRLARFNTMLEQPTDPYWKHFFLGVPAPGGCWMVLTPMVLVESGLIDQYASIAQNPIFASFMLFFVGALMASRLPTISLKALKVSRKFMLPASAAAILVVVLLFTHPWATLGIIGALYIVTVPVVVLLFIRAREKYFREQMPNETK